MQFHDKTAYVWMGILPLKKRVNRDKCSFATKQRMFGVFAIDEILRYRGTWFPGSPTLCHPDLHRSEIKPRVEQITSAKNALKLVSTKSVVETCTLWKNSMSMPVVFAEISSEIRWVAVWVVRQNRVAKKARPSIMKGQSCKASEVAWN